MKFQIDRTVLSDALAKVQHATSRGMSLPILSNVLLEASTGKDGGLKLTSTNLDICVSTWISGDLVKIAEDGVTTLPHNRIAPIVKELPASTMDFSSTGEDHVATITSGKSKFKILGLPEDEFPEIPNIEKLGNVTTFQVNQSFLKTGLKRTEFAMSTDQSRYVLQGTLMVVRDQQIHLVATDGRRLAKATFQHLGADGEPADSVIPNFTIAELQRHLFPDSEADPITVKVCNNLIQFTMSDGTKIVSKLIEGQFPNWQQVLPGQKKYRYTFDRETLIGTLRRVSLMCGDKSHCVNFNFGETQTDFFSRAPEAGEANEPIELPREFHGDNPELESALVKVGYNPEFFLNGLKVIDADAVHFDLIDGMSPALLSPATDKSETDGSEFLYVIMPMRQSGE